MDINKKQTEVEQLFNDTLALCKAMVKEAKAGRAVLKGSSLREVNQFLKFSQDYLTKKKLEIEREAELEAELEREAELDMPDFDQEGSPELEADFDQEGSIPEGMPDFDQEDNNSNNNNNNNNQSLPFEFFD